MEYSCGGCGQQLATPKRGPLPLACLTCRRKTWPSVLRSKALRDTRSCVRCGATFTTIMTAKRKTCDSRKMCRPVRVCHCGTTFVARTIAQVWCTRQCFQWHADVARRARGAFRGHEVAANRLVIAARDGWTCRLCGDPVSRRLKWPHPLSASLDHIIPLSLGGSPEITNVQLAHLRCNIRKGARVEDAAA